MLAIDTTPVVAQAVERAVMRSFETRPLPLRAITTSEARHRVQVCEQIWRALRLDKRWSVQRACDHLYRYLIAELDGVAWEPDDRSIWVPDRSQPQKGEAR